MLAPAGRGHNVGRTKVKALGAVVTYDLNTVFEVPMGRDMSDGYLQVRDLRARADQMAANYALEIRDYGRLDERQLRSDVAMVSCEFLRLLTTAPRDGAASTAAIERVALEAGRRRRMQSVSLPALLRAYRLWGKYTLDILAEEAPAALVHLASEVARQVDVVSEASIRGYHMITPTLPSGPIVGFAGQPERLEVAVVAPRYFACAPEVHHDAETGTCFLLAAAGEDELARPAEALAAELGCVLVTQAGHSHRLEELKSDLREAVEIAALLRLRPGVYDTRFMWLVSLGLSSPKYRQRFANMLAPLESQVVLRDTLEAYLDTRLSPKATAETLGIHVNTVAYRLAKVEELIRCDLKEISVRTTLHVALVLNKAAG